jgi:hypothetical protein
MGLGRLFGDGKTEGALKWIEHSDSRTGTTDLLWRDL